ncbi:MAG TPA: hypothetical protein VH724_19760 [Candidatus Angelobacter sp.]|nr:hypothetical protein [Candidatus Angelobacter sp.]
MSRGFIFGAAPLKLTTPLIDPALAASMLMVPALGADAGCSEAGWDLLHPSGKNAISKVTNTKKRLDAAFIFSFLFRIHSSPNLGMQRPTSSRIGVDFEVHP